jgi:hypothetical protein
MFKSRVDGLDRLSEALAHMFDEAALHETLLSAGNSVVETARANLEDGAPPDTQSGALAQSLFAKTAPDGAVRIGTPLDYGWHLEMGTRTRAAYPWLTSALDDYRAGLVQQIHAWLSASIRHAGR